MYNTVLHWLIVLLLIVSLSLFYFNFLGKLRSSKAAQKQKHFNSGGGFRHRSLLLGQKTTQEDSLTCRCSLVFL